MWTSKRVFFVLGHAPFFSRTNAHSPRPCAFAFLREKYAGGTEGQNQGIGSVGMRARRSKRNPQVRAQQRVHRQGAHHNPGCNALP